MCIVAVHYGCILLAFVSIDVLDLCCRCVLLILIVVLTIVSLNSCLSYWFVIVVFNCILVADCYDCI